MSLIGLRLQIILLCAIRAGAQGIKDPPGFDNLGDSELHADIPFLQKKYFKKWYIYLVASVLLATFAMSLVVVIRGVVSCARRHRSRSVSKRRIASDGGHDIEAGLVPAGKDQGLVKARHQELLSCVPSKLDTERLSRRKLDKADEETLQAERARRLAQHAKPTETLHTLRRLSSF